MLPGYNQSGPTAGLEASEAVTACQPVSQSIGGHKEAQQTRQKQAKRVHVKSHHRDTNARHVNNTQHLLAAAIDDFVQSAEKHHNRWSERSKACTQAENNNTEKQHYKHRIEFAGLRPETEQNTSKRNIAGDIKRSPVHCWFPTSSTL